MASQPALKRPRTNEATPELSSNPERSDFWKIDGNIILQAGGMQFRVHSSMLSDHSPVFKDLFAFASPGTHFSVEELPVIHLSDNPMDLLHVLKALYDRNYFHVLKPQPLAAISALLLLGDKYDLKVLRQDAIRVLHAGSPLDFTTPPTSLEIFPQVSGQRSTDFYIDLANILHESGIDTLLPIALLVILRSFDVISVLFHGADRSDGTRALLHPANTQIAVTGYYRLLALVQCRLYTLMPGPEQDCTNSTCLQHQIYFLTEVNRVGFVNHIDDMFIAPPDFFSGDLCERCDEFAQEHFSEGRKLLWTGLPSCFSAEYSWPKFRVKLAEMLA